MWFERMTLEVWFDEYQYIVDHDIGESAVKILKLGDLGIDLATVPLRYGHHTGLPFLRSMLAQDYPGLSPEGVAPLVRTPISRPKSSVRSGAGDVV
jgi:hypothetical protein